MRLPEGETVAPSHRQCMKNDKLLNVISHDLFMLSFFKFWSRVIASQYLMDGHNINLTTHTQETRSLSCETLSKKNIKSVCTQGLPTYAIV